MKLENHCLSRLLGQFAHFRQHALAVKRRHVSRVDLAYVFLGDPDPFPLESGVVSVEPLAKLLTL